MGKKLVKSESDIRRRMLMPNRNDILGVVDKNLGFTRMRVVCQEPVYPDSQLSVRLVGPGGESPPVKGRAIWLRREEQFSTIGISLRREMGERSAVLRWLREGLAAGMEQEWIIQAGLGRMAS